MYIVMYLIQSSTVFHKHSDMISSVVLKACKPQVASLTYFLYNLNDKIQDLVYKWIYIRYKVTGLGNCFRLTCSHKHSYQRKEKKAIHISSTSNNDRVFPWFRIMVLVFL